MGTWETWSTPGDGGAGGVPRVTSSPVGWKGRMERGCWHRAARRVVVQAEQPQILIESDRNMAMWPLWARLELGVGLWKLLKVPVSLH